VSEHGPDSYKVKIGIEIGWAHKTGGARRVAINTLIEMCRLNPDHEFHTFANTWRNELDMDGIHQTVLKCPSFVPQIVWDQFGFPLLSAPHASSKQDLDIIHYTNNIVPIKSSVPYVVTIHDMTPFIIPDSYNIVHGAYQRSYFKHAAKNARHIITVSENSKNDICRIFEIDEEKVSVIPLAPMNAIQPAREATLPPCVHAPYILYVGAILPRKNLPRLVRAFAQLKKETAVTHKLIIAGEQRRRHETMSRAISENDLKDEVICLGRVADAELEALYKHAELFVYPSTYEGFGLPVIEAMAHGVPVVTSKGSSLEEIAAGAAELIDPYDELDIKHGLERVISDKNHATLLSDLGRKQAQKYTWENTARKVLALLESNA
jgi:glycosyltransferase involved in cell wall biosynthesis